MSLRDYYLELEETPSLSQLDNIDTWISENRHEQSPTTISNPSAELNQNDTPIPLTGTTSASVGLHRQVDADESIDQTDTEDENVEAKINIEYCFYVADNDHRLTTTRGSNKRKAAPDPDSKFNKLKSTPGKLFFNWNTGQRSLSAFKRLVIDLIGSLDEKEFGDHAQEQEDEGMITWQAVIPHGGIFAGNQKGTLENDELFHEFLDLCRDPVDGRKHTVTLVQTDPKHAAQKEHALKSLKKKHGGSVEDNQEPSLHAKSSLAVIDNMRIIRATHMPCERLTGTSETPVFIDPKDPNRFILLTIDRISLWAQTMLVNKDVTIHNPPQSPPFAFITKEDLKAQRYGRLKSPETPTQSSSIRAKTVDSSTVCTQSSPAISSSNASPSSLAASPGHFSHPMAIPYPWFMGGMPYVPPINYGGMPGFGFPSTPYSASPAVPSNMNAMPTGTQGAAIPFGFPGMPPISYPAASDIPSTSTTSQIPSSPTTSDDNIELDDYLRFCHVDPSCPDVSAALEELGINHYRGFANIKDYELEKSGIKLVQARSLVTSLKRFKRHISRHSNRSNHCNRR